MRGSASILVTQGNDGKIAVLFRDDDGSDFFETYNTTEVAVASTKFLNRYFKTHIPAQSPTNSIEEWRVIPNFGRYEISNWGRVRSFKTGKFLKGTRHSTGYQNIGLVPDGKIIHQKHFLLHRLVAEAFLTKPNGIERPIVNHKDRNRCNNHVENLEWVSSSENACHWRRVSSGRASECPGELGLFIQGNRLNPPSERSLVKTTMDEGEALASETRCDRTLPTAASNRLCLSQ